MLKHHACHARARRAPAMQALEGFCKKNGADVAAATVEADAKGVEYVWVNVSDAGRSAAEVRTAAQQGRPLQQRAALLRCWQGKKSKGGRSCRMPDALPCNLIPPPPGVDRGASGAGRVHHVQEEHALARRHRCAVLASQLHCCSQHGADAKVVLQPVSASDLACPMPHALPYPAPPAYSRPMRWLLALQ